MKYKYPLGRFEAAVTPQQANFITKNLNEIFEDLDFESMSLEEIEKKIQVSEIEIKKLEGAIENMKRLHFFREGRFFEHQRKLKEDKEAADYEKFRSQGKFIN